MNLLVVSTWLPYPLDNGSKVRAYHLLRHLARHHTITLLAFGHPRAPEEIDPLRAFCARVDIIPPTPLMGNRLRTSGLLSTTPRYFVQTDSPPMRSLVASHVPRHDVAIGLQIDAARYLAPHPEIARVFEEAEVGILRERVLTGATWIRRCRDRLTWWKARRFVRSLVNAFERTTVVSSRERDHLAEIGCDIERVAVVPNGVEIPRVEPPVTRAPRLVYTGSVQYFANLDAVRYFVHEVFPLVSRARPDLTFTVTGATTGVDLNGMADAPGVVFTGQLPEVDTLVTDSAVAVVPLRIGGGTRLKILQAMALGTPVVSTTKGIEGLDVQADRHLLVADTPSDFAAQIARLLDDPTLGTRLARAAGALVREKYTWEPIADEFELVVEAAKEKGAARGDTIARGSRLS